MKAGYANPCDERGDAVTCQVPGCDRTARHRRQLRLRHRTGAPGCWFTRTLTGVRFPVPRGENEVICGVHLRDWKYGPLTPEDMS